MERRLAAIMAADVVGYSRLIRTDEDGTLAALKSLRTDLIGPKIAEHHGRIVKLMGGPRGEHHSNKPCKARGSAILSAPKATFTLKL
ncbi:MULTISPECIES: hypothetical protein [unclassified Sinorhizobium]|uniref:hypothetical protein n=1 Tax=unclassified Sinorhizobium TaxID=2613772 RepID=UPI0024C38DB0|nr:hypothetical protein [Sinorhizobium sp. 6-70]MDK1374738.1 hypothetical protein [Sinorhizobium sp. 6-70]